MTWKDIFAIEFKRSSKDRRKVGWVLIDRRTGSSYSKYYPSLLYAERMAKKKFDKIEKEIEKTLLT